MRIGIDARTMVGKAGVAQYGSNLLAALKTINKDDELVIFEAQDGRIPVITSHFIDRYKIIAAKLDVLHILGGTAPFGYRGKYILTVHDLAIYKHPEWFPDGQWFSTQISFPSTVRHARHIIVPSAATKQDLIELFHVKESKISIIPHGVKVFKKNTPNEGKNNFILFLGTIEPRKNVETLVRAYRLMVDRSPELKNFELRLAGVVGWKSDIIIDEIRKTQCEGYRISLLGSVSEEGKERLLSEASCFVYPSHYEGFGLPVLEAMAAGTPVVCSNVSSLPEVAGDAAILVADNDVEGFADAMSQVLKEQKKADELRQKGLARALEMSWEKTATATMKIYHDFNA